MGTLNTIKATIKKNGLSPMELGRLNKSLSQKYKFREGIYSLEEYIIKFGKGKYIAKVQTRTGIIKNIPSLKTKDNLSIDIPKIVYNSLNFSTPQG